MAWKWRRECISVTVTLILQWKLQQSNFIGNRRIELGFRCEQKRKVRLPSFIRKIEKWKVIRSWNHLECHLLHFCIFAINAEASFWNPDWHCFETHVSIWIHWLQKIFWNFPETEPWDLFTNSFRNEMLLKTKTACQMKFLWVHKN